MDGQPQKRHEGGAKDSGTSADLAIDGHLMVLERAEDEASLVIGSLKDWSVDLGTYMKGMETGPLRAHMP
jgi:hypothetical protein